MVDILNLAMIAVAARLLADLTSSNRLPAFRAYLFLFCVGLLLRWNITADSVMVLAVLVLKFAATFEANWLLFARIEASESHHVKRTAFWLAVASLIAYQDFGRQSNLAAPMIWYLKHAAQLFLAVFSSTVALYFWRWHPEVAGFARLHATLLLFLWWDYAIVGMIAPRTLEAWQLLSGSFAAVAIILLLGWILAARAIASGRLYRFDPGEPPAS